MNEEDLTRTGSVQGPYPLSRRWKPWLTALAGVVVVAALVVGGIAVAGSGGSGGPGVAKAGSSATTGQSGSGGSGGSDRDRALAFSKCMRAHGIGDFPDPNSDGGLSISAGPSSDLAPDNPQYQAANEACKQLLPNGGQPPSAADPNTADKVLAYAKCMRAHGIADFPDPGSDGGLAISAAPGSDLAPDNPQYQAADKSCKHFLPGGGKGGSTTQQNENSK